MFPKTWGGPEMPFPMQLELIEALAHAYVVRARSRGGAGGKSTRSRARICLRDGGAALERGRNARVASMNTRRDVGLARIHAHRMAAEVAQLAFDTAGSAAVYANAPFDRLLRDAVTINQHQLFNEGVLEDLGAMALGVDVATRFV